MSKLHKSNFPPSPSSDAVKQNLTENEFGGGRGFGDDVASQIGEADTWRDKIKTLVRQNKLAAFSAVVIVVIQLAAVFAPLVAPYDYQKQSLVDRLQAPSAQHWLGTDELAGPWFGACITGPGCT